MGEENETKKNSSIHNFGFNTLTEKRSGKEKRTLYLSLKAFSEYKLLQFG